MKIQIKNLGALRQAEFELGEMTIICGENNTGKTYATYALYGFLSFWQQGFFINIPDSTVKLLLAEGTTELNIDEFIKDAENILRDACSKYTKQLPKVFASAEKNFENTSFLVSIDKTNIKPVESFVKVMGAAKADIFSITKQPESSRILISLLVEREKVKIPEHSLARAIGDAVKDIIWGPLFPNPFIASAERTGAAIFRKELNFARNRLLEQMSTMERNLDPFELLNKVYSDYALPVKQNVDFTRQLEDIAKKESLIAKVRPELLSDFADIIGGEYRVIRDELYYVPNVNKRLRLTMDESSSAVRSLLDIGFYLRHVAQPGDLLMVDEPELNLHPENQRRMARMFAQLVNLGIKVFITTHSDYIIKELNTLIMLNHDKPHLKQIRRDEGYKQEELISAEKVKVYIAEEQLVQLDRHTRRSKCQTLVSADIDPELGIEARSFDTTIDAMNRIQEAIMFGGEGE